MQSYEACVNTMRSYDEVHNLIYIMLARPLYK